MMITILAREQQLWALGNLRGDTAAADGGVGLCCCMGSQFFVVIVPVYSCTSLAALLWPLILRVNIRPIIQSAAAAATM